MKPLRLILIALCSCLMAAPVVEAAVFKGRTSQDRRAKVETNDRGMPTFVAVFWEDNSCSDGKSLVLPTGFSPPFDERTRNFVRDAGRYTTRIRHDGRTYRVRVSAHIRARRVAPRRWRGTFGATAVIRRNGRFVARCRSGSVTWRASR